MTEKYTLYVGLNDKNTKVQQISTLESFKIITNLLQSYVDGATIFEADGIYKHDDSTIVVEKTLRIEILYFDDNNAKQTTKKIVDDIKRILNQESVAVQREVVESDLW